MRSVLYEAPNVIKAIEKAWANSGKPDEFSVRIYETEKRSFWGFTRKQAVVSIIFDPKKSANNAPKPVKAKPKPKKKTFSSPRQERTPKSEQKKQESNTGKKEIYTTWSSELINHVTKSLKDLLKTMNIKTPFSVKVDRHLLKVEFNKPVIDAPSEERMLFASFAYLLMQFLKRDHKKGFRGCRIAISSTRK